MKFKFFIEIGYRVPLLKIVVIGFKSFFTVSHKKNNSNVGCYFFILLRFNEAILFSFQ